ncbi:hypothetical protein FG386_001395 [Cryptosporidium ryanae]|uniref:uncharacterized protein n=1 Tax=Cryptosporidium ryanae TaxID=515981 RepID=UPI00351A4B4C|nr:hypothetical protein FG386_001395 [Cryptosporidium ryanae]
MEENFDDKKVYIDKSNDNWNQYISMESTQEVTPTSSIGDSVNSHNNGKDNILGEIIQKKSDICENETKKYKSEDSINVVIDTETDNSIEYTENENANDEELLSSTVHIEKESEKIDNTEESKSGRLEEKTSTKKGTGSRARKAEHQSGVPGVYWQESSQRWIAQWSDSLSGRRITHGFSARVYGFEDAKQMAIKSRIEAIEKGKATARKLHETMDISSKLHATNKRNRLANKEKNAIFNGLVSNNNNNIKNIMNNITDEGMCVLLEEMRHLKEDIEYEGIFWHPINKVWIGVWLDSITHETCTQSFPHEISDDGIDISRLKAIEWRLKLINEKKLRDNVVEYVNNKEFKYLGNSVLSGNGVDITNSINQKTGFDCNNCNNIILNNSNYSVYLQNYYNILMSQMLQMHSYCNLQNNVGGIHSGNNINIENMIYLANLLSSNSNNKNCNVNINQLPQMNNLITNYFNNQCNFNLNGNIKCAKNNNIESKLINNKNGANNNSDNEIDATNNENENSIDYIGKKNNENNININYQAETTDNTIKNSIIGDMNVDYCNKYYNENNVFQQLMNTAGGNQFNILNNNSINNLLLSLLSFGNSYNTMSNTNNGNANNVLLSQSLSNYPNSAVVLSQIELLEQYQHFLLNYGFFGNISHNGVNNAYINDINDILSCLVSNKANELAVKRDCNIGNTNISKLDMCGVNRHLTTTKNENNTFNYAGNGILNPLNTVNNKNFKSNDILSNVNLNDLNIYNINLLANYDLLNSTNINEIIGTDSQNYNNICVDLCNDQNNDKNYQNNSDCHNLSRSETSSSSLSSNSTDLSLKNIESSIIMDTSESNYTTPIIESTPISILTSSTSKLKTTKKKVGASANYKSGIPGVYWKTRDQEWVAEWYDQNRKRHSRHFYVKKYGFNEAKKLAIQCRLNAVNSGEAVLRSTNNNNFNVMLNNKGELVENNNLNSSSSPNINNTENSILEDMSMTVQ